MATTSRPFYGWVVVGAVFLILVTTAGLGFYNASVILAASVKELDASVSSVSGATGLFFAIAGLSGFALSRWMDTIDIRYFFTAGAVSGAAALYGLRWVTSVPALYVFFALFGIGFGLAGLVPATTLVTRWFDERRSVALSIASTGLSVGGIALTPFAAQLIEDASLAAAGSRLAAAWLIGVLPISLLALRSRPSDLGLLPDGKKTPDPKPNPDSTQNPDGKQAPDRAARPTDPAPGMSFAAARTTRLFLAVCLAYAFIYLGQVGGIAQLYNMVQGRTTIETARLAVSVLAFSSVVARLIGGVLVLRLPTKAFTASLVLIQVTSLVLLGLANTPTTLLLGAVVFGASMGNLLMLQPLILAEAFGVAEYSRIYSFNQLIGTIGVAGGPLLLGLLRDGFDYRVAFIAAGMSSFIGFVALQLAGSIENCRSEWNVA